MALQDDWARLTIRIPPDLHGRIQQAAINNGKPLNTEIMETLSREYPSISPIADLAQKILLLLEKVDDKMGKELAESIMETLGSFVVLSSKHNRELRPFAEKVLQSRETRRKKSI